MRIDSGSLQLGAAHSYFEEYRVREELRVRPPVPAPRPPGSAPPPAAARCTAADPEPGLDPRLAVLKWLFEFLTGVKAVAFNPARLSAELSHLAGKIAESFAEVVVNTRSGWGVSYSRVEIHQEAEQTLFSAQGQITTQDGRRIDFSLSLELNREFTRITRVSFRAGDANLTDPLVLTFDGSGARLDPGATGLSYASLARGSGYLALDGNHDGAIQEAELFGPRTGDGYAELAAYDGNRDGWIDEADSVFDHLAIWAPAEERALSSLRERGVGAISTASVATPFAQKDAANRLLGQVRSSGVYLTEDGAAGAVQQIDLAL